MTNRLADLGASQNLTWETPTVAPTILPLRAHGFRQHCWLVWRNGRRVRICRFIRA